MWVSTKDCLPSPHSRVLVTYRTRNGWRIVIAGRVDGAWKADDGMRFEAEEIEYWQMLPGVPRPDAEDDGPPHELGA